MRPVTLIGLGIAALLVAGAIWLFAHTGVRDPSDLDPTPAVGVKAEQPIELVGTGRATTEAPAEKTAPESEAAPAAMTKTPPGLRVEGRVVGIPASEVERCRIEVGALEDGGWLPREIATLLDGTASADGTFDLEVHPSNELMKTFSRTSHVEVIANHPMYVLERKRFDVTGHDFAEPLVFDELVFRLRAAAVVRGVVHDARGEPVPDTPVALFKAKDGAPRIEMVLPVQSKDAARTDDQGRFSLRTTADGPHLVVAARSGLLPAHVHAILTVPETTTLDPLVLRPGARISGTVSLFGDPATTGAVEVKPVRPDAPMVPIEIGDTSAVWDGTGVLTGEHLFDLDASGGFEVDGLPPGPVQVTPRIKAGALGAVVGPALARACRKEVSAPASGVDVDVRGVLVVATVVSGGGPVTDASIWLQDESSVGADADSDGRARFIARPSRKQALRVDAPGMQSRTVELETPASGTHEVEVVLTPEEVRPTLVLVLKDASGAPVPHAVVYVLPGEATATGMREVESIGGELRVDGLHPGPATLFLQPWGRMLQETGYGIPIRREIVLPAVGELRLALTAEQGGRLRIAARDEKGALLESTCVVRDAEGTDIEAMFAMQGERVSMTQGLVLGTLSPSLVDPPLEPGTYTVEITHEGTTQRVEATVSRRETTEVDVTLR